MKRTYWIGIVVGLSVLLAVLILLTVMLHRAHKPAETKPATDAVSQTSVETTGETMVTPQPTMEVTVPETTQQYMPQITPDQIGLYIPAADGTKARSLVADFSAKRTAETDIDCFEVIASNADRLDGTSFAGIWQTAWDGFANTESAKIGFRISFTLADGETVEQTVLKPSDSQWFYEYLELYLYDDINQTPGVWYTHLEDADIKENTVISSIKLTSGSKIDQVGDISLTVFVYNDPLCFDLQGRYVGDVSYTVVITG